jgi:hypothetical protein
MGIRGVRLAKLGLRRKTIAVLGAARILEVHQLLTYTGDELLAVPDLSGHMFYEIAYVLRDNRLALLAFPDGRAHRPARDRELAILYLRVINGCSAEAIGLRCGLSKERVRQILRGHFGLSRKLPTNARRRAGRRAKLIRAVLELFHSECGPLSLIEILERVSVAQATIVETWEAIEHLEAIDFILLLPNTIQPCDQLPHIEDISRRRPARVGAAGRGRPSSR